MRGFAFTLGLTTIIDVVVVFLFTKPLLTLLARTKFFGRGQQVVRSRSRTASASSGVPRAPARPTTPKEA